MEDKIRFWQQNLQATTGEVLALCKGLDSALLNTRPAPGSWSLAEILQHLIQITQSYYPIIDSIRQGEYKPGWLGRRTFMTRFFGNFILQSSMPDHKRKVKTMYPWLPEETSYSPEIVEDYRRERERFISIMGDSKDLLEKGTIIHSPASKRVTYTLERGFDIIVAHEKRHLQQAQETLTLVSNEQSSD